MAWIEFHDTVIEHYKTKDLARCYGCEVNTAIGMLGRFWLWCVKFADDGDLRRHNDDRIGDSVGLNGEQAKRFVDAMVQSCWIDRKPYFRVHDWWDFAKSFLKSRYKDEPEKWQKIKRLYENKTPVLHQSNTRVTPATYQPNQPTKPTNLPTDTPKDGVLGGERPPPDKPLTDIQKTIRVFKVCQGVDVGDKVWDREFFSRYSRAAKSLLNLLGDWRTAGNCIQDVYERLTSKGLTVTMETVIKHAVEWRKDKQEREAKRGVLSGQGV